MDARSVNSEEQYLRRLGLEIRRHRQGRGLSQESFAEVVGLHRTYVGAIERGERNITIGSLLPIAKALNMTIAQLLTSAESGGSR
jgi:transcriptional regulator with XRE-family HTH domain